MKKDFERCNEIIYSAIDKVKISRKMKGFLRGRYTLEGISNLSGKCHIIVGEKYGKVQGSGKLCGSEIGMMYINPQHQRKGIGRGIMKRLENFARRKGIKKIYVHALRPATGFYKKIGYTKVANKKTAWIIAGWRRGYDE